MFIFHAVITVLALLIVGYYYVDMYFDVKRLKETVDNIQGELIEIKKLIKKGCKK